MERHQSPRAAPKWWKRIGLLAAFGWVGFLAYLLLAADPPDFWFDDIGTFDGPGHLVGGAVTGLVTYLLVARRRYAFLLAAGITIGLLLGLEFIQELFTDRGYEASDVVLTITGAVVGVSLAAVGGLLVRRRRAGASSPTHLN